MTELEKLEALAKAATPGPWKALGGYVTTRSEQAHAMTGLGLTEMGQDIHNLHSPYQSVRFARDEDAAFIAAANPQAILTLIQEKREARSKALEEAEKLVMETLGELEYLAGDGDIFEVPRKWITDRFRALTPGETP